MRKHHSLKPVLLALLGSGTLLYTMYVDYSRLVEIMGFAALGVAAYLDYRMRRWAGVGQHGKRVARQRGRKTAAR